MQAIERLIRECCPDGVKFCAVGDVTKYEQPGKYIVKTTDYNDSFSIPVLTAGQTFILGKTNESDGIYKASKDYPVIIFDDFTGAFKWVDFQFKVKSSAMKIITADEEHLSLRYLYHIMSNIGFKSDEHKRLWIATYSQFPIPLPPLPVQQEIVRILDSFTELTAELTAELTTRRRQYEHYRDELLTFGDDVEQKIIGDVCVLSAGGDVPKEKFSKERTREYPVPIFSNGIGENALYGFTDIAKIKAPCVTVAARGTIGNCELRNEDFFPIVRLICACPKKEILPAFLKYYIETIRFQVPTSGIPQLTVPMLAKYQIPVPHLEEQKRIVHLLSKFDALCNDLTAGLPAEIAARQKQYEYYRDKLLTFKEIT